ncbi:septum formation initiator family protein [bacterium]|nr:septum formation initiator family protein [bacterium]
MSKETINKDTTYFKQKKERTLTKFKRFLLFLILGTIVSFLISFFFIKSYMVKSAEYNAKLAEIKILQQEKEKLEEENEILQSKIEYLKTEKGIESVAREKLGLVKPSEIAFIVVNDKNDPISSTKIKKSKKEKIIEKDTTKKEIKQKKVNWLDLLWRDLFSGGNDKKK